MRALLGLTAQAGEVKAQEIYFTREMQNHHGGVVLVNGYLYGFNNSILTCLTFASGETMWRHRSVGKGGKRGFRSRGACFELIAHKAL